MNRHVKELLNKAKSNNEYISHDALISIGFLLEKHTYKPGDETTYKAYLHKELCDHKLNVSEIDAILSTLMSLVQKKSPCADIAIWALGKSHNEEIYDGLKSFLVNNWQTEKDSVTLQLLRTLELDLATLKKTFPTIQEISRKGHGDSKEAAIQIVSFYANIISNDR